VRPLFSGLLVVVLAIVTELLLIGGDAPIRWQVIGYSVALFVGCMFCHGELYRRRPHPSRLTSYYLTISAGGALGGLLVAIVAPLVFNSYLEFPIGYWMLSALLALLAIQKRDRSLAFGALAGSVAGLIVALAIRGEQSADSSGSWPAAFLLISRDFLRDHWKVLAICAVGALQGFVDLRRVILRDWRPRMGSYLIFLCLVVGFIFYKQAKDSHESSISMSRNFFGTLTVYEYGKDNPSQHYYVLQHGQIIHGLQFTDPERAMWPTTYYAETSGVGLALKSLSGLVGVRIGLVGLGTGTVAAYGEKGNTIRIYEINPQVKQLATSRFSYITRTPAKVEVVMGDARLSLEKELEEGDSQQFDLLVLDAFNSDAIPVHLLTREAFAVYLKHMRPDGIIAIDISNRYLDLQPVVESLAKNFGLDAITISDDGEPDWWFYDTSWVLVATHERFEKTRGLLDAADAPNSDRRSKNPPPLWTDEYTSLFKILR
jgi:SAM-dependent methyltransferase